MKTNKRILLLLSLLPTLLSSCNKTEKSNTIYATFFPIYDMAKKIAGDKFEVKCLTHYGQEPHDYEPTAKEIVGMTSSPALLLNGLGLDKWSDSLPQELKEKTTVVTKGIQTKEIDGVVDPHVWLSVKNAMTELLNIKNTFIEIDSINKDYYETNYEKELSRFKELDESFTTQLGSVKNKYLVVSHAAFSYLTSEYGLEQIYISGLEPDSAPTAKKMEELIEKVKEYHVSTIFYEEAVSPDIAKKIAEESHGKTKTLFTLESIEEEEEGKVDYVSLMEENLSRIVEACNDDSI